MTTVDEVRDWTGRDLYGEGHEKIGEIDTIYVDNATGEPEWLAVKTGLFGMNLSFVPIAGATMMDDHVVVPYSKSTVKDAPNVDPDAELTLEQERSLYEHYERDWGTFPAGEADRSGRGTDSSMTRSEEEMVVGSREREAGRARLRKYVVTEEVEQRVPVSREEVRVEREPITDASADEVEGRPFHEDEREVTLHEEEPVVEKRVVPKERVRLEKDRELGEETVEGEIRKEHVDAEGDITRR